MYTTMYTPIVRNISCTISAGKNGSNFVLKRCAIVSMVRASTDLHGDSGNRYALCSSSIIFSSLNLVLCSIGMGMGGFEV